MTCKANFVHTVKEIMPRSLLPTSVVRDQKRHNIPIPATDRTQKDLDTARGSYIIVFTQSIRDFGDPADARRPSEKIQARRPEAARHPQSASRRGNRSTLPNRRFLRFRRSRTGQVRDASSRKSG